MGWLVGWYAPRVSVSYLVEARFWLRTFLRTASAGRLFAGTHLSFLRTGLRTIFAYLRTGLRTSGCTLLAFC